MITNVTAAVAATALVAILISIGTLLTRASSWPDFTESPKHAPHPDAYQPRPYDQVILSEAYISIPLPKTEDEPEVVAPISAPPAAEEPTDPLPVAEEPTAEEPVAEPIDPLDPRWDWRAYADALGQELVAA